MGAFYIYKTNSMATAFSVAPTLTSINYTFSPESDIEKISTGDKVLIFKSAPMNNINIGLDVISKNVDGSISLNKLFETSKGCALAEIPSLIKTSLIKIGDNSMIQIAESDYASIVSSIFEVEIKSLSGIASRILPETILDIVCKQKIYYGAPGTGKSHTIKEDTADSDNKITTTFHPDTDYASFVGCYKPQVEDDGKTITYKFTPQAFANAYVKAWKLLLGGKVEISSLYIKEEYGKWLPNNGVNSINTYNNCINGIKYDEYENGFEITDPSVVESILSEKYSGDDLPKSDQDKRSHLKKYKAFLEWLSARSESVSEDKNFYLIIEEINRGNCAQIFGDLFQLLDRNEEGYSDYVIDVDKDFTEFLIKELVGLDGYKEQICKLAKIENVDNFSFSKIALPANLSILATMNTSDQSLFPMDSAFKRRWDWEYIPINPSLVDDVMINIGENQYSWSEFIANVNIKINKAHDSEDKQLGPYFIKSIKDEKEGKEIKSIAEELFVSKVMFYLWYEVFKDEVSNTIFFTKEKTEGSSDKKNTPFSFNKLFMIGNKELGKKINSVLLEKFFADSLEMKPINKTKESPISTESETVEN